MYDDLDDPREDIMERTVIQKKRTDHDGRPFSCGRKTNEKGRRVKEGEFQRKKRKT